MFRSSDHHQEAYTVMSERYTHELLGGTVHTDIPPTKSIDY
jgi:hypothetical protein